MSRLCDRLMTSKLLPQVTKNSFRREPPIVVSADNVAQYAHDNPDIMPQWYEQPMYRCPFDSIFIEIQRPAGCSDLPYAWGIGFSWKRTMDTFADHMVNYRPMFGTIFVQETPMSDVDAKWGVHFTMDDFGNLDHDPASRYVIEVVDYGPYTQSIPDASCMNGYRWELTDEGDRLSRRLLNPLMMALTLINCKNVELTDTYPLHHESRVYQKKNHTPLVTYKTIKVNPMRTVKHVTDLDTQNAPHTPSSADMPLSIWRGHFKDYRDGKGLFGNPAMKGVYWWDQHVRGSIDNGVTVKDYAVQAPKVGVN